MRRICTYIVLFLLTSINLYAAIDNRLLVPEGKPITDIGYKHPSDVMNQQLQKVIVKLEAKLREIEGSFKLERRKITTKDCLVDDYGFETCPESAVQCSGFMEYSRGYAIEHKERIEEDAEWTSVDKEHSVDGAFYGDMLVPKNAGSYTGASTNLVYQDIFNSQSPQTLFNQGWRTEDGKFGMLLFNFGSGDGALKVRPAPSRYKKVVDGGGFWDDWFFNASGVHTHNGQYATYLVEWDYIPSSISFICDDYCLISKPSSIAGYRGKGCTKDGYQYDDVTGKCVIEYKWYEYVCANEDGWEAFLDAEQIPPFKKEDMYNQNHIMWRGPMKNTGGDCAGTCGSVGCSCNSPTPPEENCVRPNYTCPIDPKAECARVPTGSKENVNAVYDKGYLFDIGNADHFWRELRTQKICPGQDEPNMIPYDSIIIENIDDHAFTYATRPYVSPNRHLWTNSMKMQGLSLSRTAFLLNDGKWYVSKNRKPYGACGYSPDRFAYLPDGMLEILEWYSSSKCYYYSSPTSNECIKKARLNYKDGKYVVAISDIETVARAIFNVYGCTGDNSFDQKFRAYPEEKGPEASSILKRQTIRIESPVALDLSAVAARNVGPHGVEWDPKRQICRMKVPGKCLKDNYIYVASLDACLGPAACNGYLNPETGECEEKPNVDCKRPGYSFNKNMQRCERNPVCPSGYLSNTEDHYKMCISEDFKCQNGFTYNESMHSCVKKGLISEKRKCQEPFLYVTGDGLGCYGSVDTYMWELYDPADNAFWVRAGNAAAQFTNGYPTALKASAFYEFGYVFTGTMQVVSPYDRFRPENRTKHFMGLVIAEEPDGTMYIVDYNGQDKPEVGGTKGFRLIKAKIHEADIATEWWKNSSSVQVLRTVYSRGYDYDRNYQFDVRYIKKYYTGKFKLEVKIGGQTIFSIDDVTGIIGNGEVPGRPGILTAFQDRVKFENLYITSWPSCPKGYIYKPMDVKGGELKGECIKLLDGAVIDQGLDAYISIPTCAERSMYTAEGYKRFKGHYDKDLGKCIYSPQCL